MRIFANAFINKQKLYVPLEALPQVIIKRVQDSQKRTRPMISRTGDHEPLFFVLL